MVVMPALAMEMVCCSMACDGWGQGAVAVTRARALEKHGGGDGLLLQARPHSQVLHGFRPQLQQA